MPGTADIGEAMHHNIRFDMFKRYQSGPRVNSSIVITMRCVESAGPLHATSSLYWLGVVTIHHCTLTHIQNPA